MTELEMQACSRDGLVWLGFASKDAALAFHVCVLSCGLALLARTRAKWVFCPQDKCHILGQGGLSLCL